MGFSDAPHAGAVGKRAVLRSASQDTPSEIVLVVGFRVLRVRGFQGSGSLWFGGFVGIKGF